MSKEVLGRRFFVACAVLCSSLFSIGAIYEKSGFYAGLSAGAGYNASTFNGEGATVGNLGGITDFKARRKISTCGFEKDLDGFIG